MVRWRRGVGLNGRVLCGILSYKMIVDEGEGVSLVKLTSSLFVLVDFGEILDRAFLGRLSSNVTFYFTSEGVVIGWD